MTADTLHPLAAEYLERLRRAGRRLPPMRLRELLAEVEGQLSEAIDPNASDAQALTALDKLGEPEAIIAAETPRPDEFPERRGTREWAAIILLLSGGFILGVGWLVGLTLLWSSRAWSTRDKWIGTLVIPRRPRDQRVHRAGRARQSGSHRTVLWHSRRRTALHQHRRTEHRVEHSRNRCPHVSRAGSDRDVRVSRPPRRLAPSRGSNSRAG